MQYEVKLITEDDMGKTTEKYLWVAWSPDNPEDYADLIFGAWLWATSTRKRRERALQYAKEVKEND